MSSGIKVSCLASTTRAPWQHEHTADVDVQQRPHNQIQQDVDMKDVEANGEDSISADDSNNNEHDASTVNNGHGNPTTTQLPGPSKSTHRYPANHTRCIEETQLSPDGTCIFTRDHDRRFSVYPLQANPWGAAQTTRTLLTPYAQLQFADPIWAFAVNPLFDVNDASTTTVLLSQRENYITLHNALWDFSPSPSPASSSSTSSNSTSSTSSSSESSSSSINDTPPKPINISTKLAAYKLINQQTEAITAPLSLVYSHSGAFFFAGHANEISIFDASYTDKPVSSIPTIPSARSKRKGNGVGFKGLVTSLALSPSSVFAQDGVLAAGTRTRHVGLYDARTEKRETCFGLPTSYPSSSSSEATKNIAGGGISQLQWSPSGTYLCIAERRSDSILIYDARNYAMALAHCTGRAAMTNQRLGFDVWSAGDGYGGYSDGAATEIWAGGTDGCVRVWRDPWEKAGSVEADHVVDVGEACGGVEDSDDEKEEDDGEESDTTASQSSAATPADPADEAQSRAYQPIVSTLVHASGSLAVVARGKRWGAKGPDRGGKLTTVPPRDHGRLDILGLQNSV